MERENSIPIQYMSTRQNIESSEFNKTPSGKFTCLSSTTVTDENELEGWWGSLLRGFSHGEVCCLKTKKRNSIKVSESSHRSLSGRDG